MPFFKSCFFCFLLGIASHYVGEALPRRWFHWDRFPFRSWRWEREGKIYDLIHIRAWKDRLPDMSRVMKDMIPKKVGVCPTSAEVMILVKETCVAEIIHVVLCICAPVIYFFWHNGVGVFLTWVFIIGNIPFILIQRYNRPALVSLARRLCAREERKQHARAHSIR